MTPVALSYRRGDRFLGSRNGTIAALVESGRLTAIPWGRRFRVLTVDVERIAAEGFTINRTKPRRPKRKPPRPGIAERIAAMPLPQPRNPSQEETP